MYIYMRVPKTQPGESQILLTVTKYSSADPSVRLCEKNADTTDCLQGEDTIDVSLVDAVDGQSEVSHAILLFHAVYFSSQRVSHVKHKRFYSFLFLI